MVTKYCKFFLILNLLNTFVKAIIITQTEKKVGADDPESRLFYIKEDMGLVQVSNSEPRVISPLQHGEHATTLDYHYPKKLLFWVTSNGAIFTCNLRQPKNVTLVYNDEKWQPIAIAVDYLDDRLYIVDAITNTLRLFGLDGQLFIVIPVRSRNFQSTHVELDPDEGYVFLLDNRLRHGHILRTNMDGSNPILIDPYICKMKNQTDTITLDRINKRIIVSSRTEKKIFTVDYNGKILHTILQRENGVSSMSITRNELFWVNADYYSYGTSFVDGSVYKCKYKNDQGCVNGSIYELYESFPGIRVLALKAVEPDSQNCEAYINNHNNTMPNDCEQLRLGARCACKLGWSLEKDSKSCKRVEEFLIYEDNQIIRSICLEEERIPRCQAVKPFEVKLRLKNNERTGFAYDSTTRKLYYGGKESIYSVEINSTKSKQLLYQKGVFFGPMVIDWITKNLYFTEIEWRGNVTFYVLKAMSARTDDLNLVEASTSLLWEFGRIHSIAIHPNRGYLFISTFDNKIKKYRLIRLNANARNLTVLSAPNEAKFISLDYSKNKLYVINPNGTSISRTDLKGREFVKVANISSIRNITGFLVHDALIYVKNYTGIHRFNKTNGVYLGELDLFPYGRNMSANLRLHSTRIFSTENSNNPCAKNNGNCDNFCFALPQSGEKLNDLQKLCRCFDGVKCDVKSKA